MAFCFVSTGQVKAVGEELGAAFIFLHLCLSLSSLFSFPFFLESNTFTFYNHKHEIEDEISPPKINSVLLAAVKAVEIK